MKQVEKLSHHVKKILSDLDLDISSPGLLETPERVARMLSDFISKPKEPEIKTFPNEACYDQIIVVRNIPFVSLCEHHLLPFWGHITIGYLPKEKLLGFSKFFRISEYFSKGINTQEKITQDLASYIFENLEPLGCGVIIEAEHSCISFRGVSRPGHSIITSAVLGVFREELKVKEEFFNLAGLRCATR